MYKYTRDVFYYETDKMGIVHHSNYVRWLEEARDAYFNEIDLAYVETERLGYLCPITDVSMKYKYPARFGEAFTVKMKVTKYTGVRFKVVYEVVNEEGKLLVEAESSHAFVDPDLKPVSLARAIPERHLIFKSILEADEDKDDF